MWHTLPYHSVLSAVQLRSLSITFTDNMAANDNPNGTYATAEDSVATSARNQTRGIVPEEHPRFPTKSRTEVAKTSAYPQARLKCDLRWSVHLLLVRRGPHSISLYELPYSRLREVL